MEEKKSESFQETRGPSKKEEEKGSNVFVHIVLSSLNVKRKMNG